MDIHKAVFMDSMEDCHTEWQTSLETICVTLVLILMRIVKPLEEQNRLIEEGYYDFIVTYYFYEPEWDNYELVQEEADLYIDYTGEAILDGHKLYKRI